MQRLSTFALLCLLTAACKEDGSVKPSAGSPSGDIITLDPSKAHQTMAGWEQSIVSTVREYYPFLAHLGPILDQATDDLGLDRVSIAVTAGVENPSDACQRAYLDRMANEAQYVACAYNSVNDNADPAAVNPNGFHFPILDWQIENLVLPLRQRLEARGERLYVQLRYVDFAPSPFEHNQNPEEYAELMQVVFDHMHSKYGFTPDALDVMNEPDTVAGWGAAPLGPTIAATGRRLEARGYRPAFVAPSTADKSRAPAYFDQIIAAPGADRYLRVLSWHCYSDNGPNSAAAIGSRALQYGLGTAMTECWHRSNTYHLLHQELKVSRNGSWQLGILHGPNGYYEVNTTTGGATLRPKARFIRQYFKYVRAGATRIEAATTSTVFDPVAFVNADGKFVVVVKATAGGSFTVKNLPAGTYGTFYTTGPDGLTVTDYDISAPDRTIARGQDVTASIPSAGVITLYAKSGGASRGALAPQVRDGVSHFAEARSASALDVAPQGACAHSKLPTCTSWALDRTVVTRDGVRFGLFRIPGDVLDPVDFGFSPDGRVFVAERGGRIRVVRDGRVLAVPALSRDEREDDGEEFLALALDPGFAQNRFIYTISTTGSGDGTRSFRLARYRELADTLAERVVLLDRIEADADDAAASLRFGPDGKLFAAFDDARAAALAGDLASPNGKVLRLNPDGTTPDDQVGGNPLFSYPYRSPRGFGWDRTGRTLWVADRGRLANGGRLTIVKASDGLRKRGEVQSVLSLPPESAVSSIAYFPAGSGTSSPSILVASDEGRHLLRLQVSSDDPTRVVSTERLLQDEIGGIRVVGVGYDRSIYFGTSTALGVLTLAR